MLVVTGKLGSFEHKKLDGSDKSVINGTFNIYSGREFNPASNKYDGANKPDIPIKFSAFGEQADFISKNYKEGDFMRMAADPKLNTYTPKDDPSKTAQYVSYNVRAVLEKDVVDKLRTEINYQCKSANGKNLEKQSAGPELNAPGKTPQAPAVKAPTMAMA